MGWKSVKDHYRISHIVKVINDMIHIGSAYVGDIIVLSPEGKIVRSNNSYANKDIVRYQQEFEADPQKLAELIAAPDKFEKSIPVYTWEEDKIIERYCEEPGWPNITHDGDLMYENSYSTDQNQVVEWAKSNAEAWAKSLQREIVATEESLAKKKRELAHILEIQTSLESLGKPKRD